MKNKYQIGETVNVKTRKSGRFTAVVEEIHRDFTEVDASGRFVRGGLVNMDYEIKSICLPHRFDGTTLEVDFPEKDFGGFIQKAHTTRSVFSGYSYSVRGPKGLYLVGEKQIKGL